jgi:hypothetical protein
MDYKREDPLPAVHPTTWAFSRIPRLVMHYSGFLCDNTKRAAYYLHPEMWSESSNTIITTLNNYLTSLPTLYTDLILGVDGHTTNNNQYVCSYPQKLLLH